MERRLQELRRLRAAYARRHAGGLDDRYAPYEPANLFRLQQIERDISRTLRERRLLPWGARTALDVGCGGGWWPRMLLRWGARPEQLAGVDALADAVRSTRTVHPALRILRAAADSLPFADGSFDLVSQFTVFSSILDMGVRRRAASEMCRVLRPGGLILWYDFAFNPTNPDTRGIGVGEVRRLFPGCRIDARAVTLAPPIARLIAPRSWLTAELLEVIPLLRTHRLIAITPPPEMDGGVASR